MPMTLSKYIKQLQELEAAGHGDLPVCLFDGEESPGWTVVREDAAPKVLVEEYQDEHSTAHSWQAGRFIAL